MGTTKQKWKTNGSSKCWAHKIYAAWEQPSIWNMCIGFSQFPLPSFNFQMVERHLDLPGQVEDGSWRGYDKYAKLPVSQEACGV